MGHFSSFDNPETSAFTVARQDFLGQFLGAVQRETQLTTALDVGCGLGDFARFLSDRGLKVVGLDGREQNTREASNRHASIPFLTHNAEELPTRDLGTFDFVLCFGLLYHLENPFRAIRNLYALTAKVLLVEGICMPDSNPIMTLMDEWHADNQGLNHVAFYPSASCLVKMLYRAGFPHVYGFNRLPDYRFYHASRSRKRERTILAASKLRLELPDLVPEADSLNSATDPNGPWTTALSKAANSMPRLNNLFAFTTQRVPRFLRRPWNEKREIISWYLKRKGTRT